MTAFLEWLRPRDDLQNLLALLFSGWASLACFAALRHFLPLKPGKWRLPVAFMLVYFAVATIVYVGDPVNLLGMAVLMAACLLLFFDGPLAARASLAVIFFCIMGSTNAVFDSAIPVSVGLLPLRACLWTALALAVKKTMPRHSALFAGRLWALVDVLAVMPAACLFTVVLFGDDNRGYSEIPGQVVILLCGALASVALLVAVVLLANYTRLEQAQVLETMRHQFYDQLEQHQTQVRRLRHDMANHLATLATLQGEQARAYLQELIDSPAIQGGARHCENEVVNAVLSAKLARAAELRVPVELEASLPRALPLPGVDLCALFANSLDNAIEASVKLPEERRLLRLEARAAGEMLVLRVFNAAPAAPKREKGRIVTTKADQTAHGFGLAGIREIARRHGGEVHVTATDADFTLLITIPLPPGWGMDGRGANTVK